MICSLTNKSSIYLKVDLTNGASKILSPNQKWLFDDTQCRPTDVTWELVELGLIEDKDEEAFTPEDFDYRYAYESLLECGKQTQTQTQTHNWALEGF